MSDTSTRILKNTSFLYGKMITTFVVALYTARVCWIVYVNSWRYLYVWILARYLDKIHASLFVLL